MVRRPPIPSPMQHWSPGGSPALAIYLGCGEKSAPGDLVLPAARTNMWFVTDDREPPPPGEQVQHRTPRRRDHESHRQHFFGDSGITHFTIVYEDFLEDYSETVEKVLDWLGVERGPGFGVEPPGIVKPRRSLGGSRGLNATACSRHRPAAPCNDKNPAGVTPAGPCQFWTEIRWDEMPSRAGADDGAALRAVRLRPLLRRRCHRWHRAALACPSTAGSCRTTCPSWA